MLYGLTTFAYGLEYTLSQNWSDFPVRTACMLEQMQRCISDIYTEYENKSRTTAYSCISSSRDRFRCFAEIQVQYFLAQCMGKVILA